MVTLDERGADKGRVARARPNIAAEERSKEMKRPASLFSAVIFGLIALLHVLRTVFQVRVTAGAVEIPIWASIPAVVFFAALGAWLWAERRG